MAERRKEKSSEKEGERGERVELRRCLTSGAASVIPNGNGMSLLGLA